ncbi:MAG: hypothetical protein ACYTF6_06755, partial [Planctomycetota bacterium]
GIKLKDVLFQVGQYYVVTLDDLGMVLEKVSPGSSVRIGVVRGNEAIWVPIRTQAKLRADLEPGEDG